MTNTNNYELKEPNALTTENKTSDNETFLLRLNKGYYPKIKKLNIQLSNKITELQQLHDQKVHNLEDERFTIISSYNEKIKEKDKEIEKRKDMFWKMKEALEIRCDEYAELQAEIINLNKQMNISAMRSFDNLIKRK